MRFRLHSPVALHLYDSEGNHTGLIPNPDPASETRFYEARIPNSYYLEFDDTKYAGADTFATTTIVLRGEALGTFNFDIDETLGDQLTATTTFSDIPVTASTTATLSLSSIASMTSLIMDVDGDGTTDVSIIPGEGVTPEELMAILKGIIKTLPLSDKQKTKLLKSIAKIEKILLKELKNEKPKKNRLENAFQKLINEIQKLKKKKALTTEEARELIKIIEVIEENVIK